MPNLDKPIQTEGLTAIRQTINNIFADATEGPLLKAILRTALDLPYRNVAVLGAAVTLNYEDHNGAIIELEAADTVVTLPAQADYAWPGLPVIFTIRSAFAFTINTGTGVDLNGEVSETWECDPIPNAVTIHWKDEDEWGGTGAMTIAP